MGFVPSYLSEAERLGKYLSMPATLFSDRGVLRVAGADAGPFLDNLLTSTVSTLAPGAARAQGAYQTPSGLKRNDKYQAGRALSAEADATSYNNYYEFNMSKNVVRQAQALKMSPWSIQISGMVTAPEASTV